MAWPGVAAPRKSPREIEMIQKQMKRRHWVPKLDRRLGLAQLAAVIALIYFYCCSPALLLPLPHTTTMSRQGSPALELVWNFSSSYALCPVPCARAEVTKSSLTIAPAQVS